jgi:hypothetical protein
LTFFSSLGASDFRFWFALNDKKYGFSGVNTFAKIMKRTLLSESSYAPVFFVHGFDGRVPVRVLNGKTRILRAFYGFSDDLSVFIRVSL